MNVGLNQNTTPLCNSDSYVANQNSEAGVFPPHQSVCVDLDQNIASDFCVAATLDVNTSSHALWIRITCLLLLRTSILCKLVPNKEYSKGGHLELLLLLHLL